MTSTLAAPASVLGVIEGVSDALAGIARIAGGAPADDPGRRRSIAVGGYTATALMSAAIGAATNIWQVGLLRAGAWTSRGLRVPARNALLADAVPPGAYGRAYGFERAMDNAGAVIGPIVAAILVATIGIRPAIIVSVIPGLLAAAAIVYAIRHIRPERQVERRPLRIRIRPLLTARLRPLFGSISAFELGNCAATMLILRATELLAPELGHTRATTSALGLYATYNLVATLSSIFGGRYSDRASTTRVLFLGFAAFFIAYLAIALGSGNWFLLLPMFVMAGIGIGFVETAEHAAIATYVDEEIRGSGFGLLAGVQSGGNLAASAIAGLLWSTFGARWAFVYLAVWMLLAMALLFRTSRIWRGISKS